MRREKGIILALAALLAVPVNALDCPFERENDAYPGFCGMYLDEDTDGMCDLGQSPNKSTGGTQQSKANQDAPAGQSATSSTLASAFSLFPASTGGYDFINLTVAMMAVYGASFILYRRGSITVRTHRMVWNILLLFTFIVSAGLGVLLLLKINYGIVYPLPLNMLYWHVEAGIAMTLISVFHILWHLDYFKCAFGGGSRAAEKCETDAGRQKGIRARRR